MDATPIEYSRFGARLGALLLDGVILSPLFVLIFWGGRHYRLFSLYYLIPQAIFALFYSVYLVRRYGGTPGKLIVGLRIRRLDGSPIGYGQAFVRFLPWWLIGIVGSVIAIARASHISDADFYSLYHVLTLPQRVRRLAELDPSWARPVQLAMNS
jgi:uncharacterized RDD family membrane protein YckC